MAINKVIYGGNTLIDLTGNYELSGTFAGNRTAGKYDVFLWILFYTAVTVYIDSQGFKTGGAVEKADTGDGAAGGADRQMSAG